MANDFSFSEVDSAYYSPGQLQTLGTVTVGIAGLGGIGSNVAIMLVRSGLTRFIMADFDRVSATNLNRQAYEPRHIGRLKVDCLQEICGTINSRVTVASHAVRINRSNADSLFASCDIIIEAFDDPAAKAMLFGEFLPSGKTLIGVSGIAGIGRSDEITVKNIRRNCYLVGDSVSAVNEATKPHAPRVMVAAAKMADIALEHALHPNNSCIDRVSPH